MQFVTGSEDNKIFMYKYINLMELAGCERATYE